MAVNPLYITPTLTIMGNTETEKLIGSMAEIQIKKVLSNSATGTFGFRAQLTAQQINEIAGITTGIYRVAHRGVWGTKYDVNTGATRQQMSASVTPIQLDKMLNVKFEVEDYDLKAFLDSEPAVQGTLIGEWVGSVTLNLLQNQELIFLRGVQDYYVARYEKDKSSVLVFDPESIKTEDDAKKFFMQQGLFMNKKIQLINESIVGTNKSDWVGALSYNFTTQLTQAFTGFIDNIGAKTLTGGNWYENSVFGMAFTQLFWLGLKFDKGTKTQMNRDIDYDLSLTNGIFAHVDNIAMPLSWSKMVQVINPETTNLMWVGKARLALPTALRGDLGFIVMAKEPTAEQITAAKARGRLANAVDPGVFDDLNTHSYQVASFDTTIDLGTTPPEGGETPPNFQAKIDAEVAAGVKAYQTQLTSLQEALNAEKAAKEKIAKEFKEAKDELNSTITETE